MLEGFSSQLRFVCHMLKLWPCAHSIHRSEGTEKQIKRTPPPSAAHFPRVLCRHSTPTVAAAQHRSPACCRAALPPGHAPVQDRGCTCEPSRLSRWRSPLRYLQCDYQLVISQIGIALDEVAGRACTALRCAALGTERS
eukprot:4260351-Pleurochrysis_carterae.AAC.4